MRVKWSRVVVKAARKRNGPVQVKGHRSKGAHTPQR